MTIYYSGMKGEQLILEKLEKIERELEDLKINRVDQDTILDEQDKRAIKKAQKEEKASKLIPLEKLKKELGL